MTNLRIHTKYWSRNLVGRENSWDIKRSKLLSPCRIKLIYTIYSYTYTYTIDILVFLTEIYLTIYFCVNFSYLKFALTAIVFR